MQILYPSAQTINEWFERERRDILNVGASKMGLKMSFSVRNAFLSFNKQFDSIAGQSKMSSTSFWGNLRQLWGKLIGILSATGIDTINFIEHTANQNIWNIWKLKIQQWHSRLIGHFQNQRSAVHILSFFWWINKKLILVLKNWRQVKRETIKPNLLLIRAIVDDSSLSSMVQICYGSN